VTLAIAVIGLCVAIGGLVWQWRSWTYEGPKVKVRVRQGFLLRDVSGDLFWIVSAINVGRSPVELTGWGMELSPKNVLQMFVAHPSSTSLPHTLNGGHHATFFMPKEDLRASLAERGLPKTVRPFVSTSVQERVYGERLTIPLEPS